MDLGGGKLQEFQPVRPAIVNIKVIHWPSKTDPLGGADVFLDLTTRLGQDFVDILSGS